VMKKILANEIIRILRPYYKNPLTPTGLQETPQFRKTLTPDQIQHVFGQLHELARDLLLEEINGHNSLVA
jgi:hypothetical protein